MKIGLIDVDGHNFPNLPLMKLSAYHKSKGDSVEWYSPLLSKKLDIVYASKVFSFTDDYKFNINADKIIKGGTGYAISLINGKEVYDKTKDKPLPDEIEHIYPDYDIYNIKDIAYGFLTRGCPRGCSFCHVKDKEGLCSYKVANVSEFWRGQKKIILSDPNILACKDWKELFLQILSTKASIDFNQGLDIRLMNEEKARMISKMKIKNIHFAWDRIEDKDFIEKKFEEFREISTKNSHNLKVFVLCGDREPKLLEQDLYRVMWLRNHGYTPYVMLYNKSNLPKGHELIKLQGWTNNMRTFFKYNTFEEYIKKENNNSSQISLL